MKVTVKNKRDGETRSYNDVVAIRENEKNFRLVREYNGEQYEAPVMPKASYYYICAE